MTATTEKKIPPRGPLASADKKNVGVFLSIVGALGLVAYLVGGNQASSPSVSAPELNDSTGTSSKNAEVPAGAAPQISPTQLSAIQQQVQAKIAAGEVLKRSEGSPDEVNFEDMEIPEKYKDFPPDLVRQLLSPPPELPEDLKRQLAEPNPPLPEEMRAQLAAPKELPESVKLQLDSRIDNLPEEFQEALQKPLIAEEAAQSE